MIKNILSYLKYLMVHKWYVFLECVRFGIPVRGLVHDLDKFMPDVFFGYVKYAYSNGKNVILSKQSGYFKPDTTGSAEFDLAWLIHRRRTRHHWEWWLYPLSDGTSKPLEMSKNDALEMVCDWIAASITQGFDPPKYYRLLEVQKWYRNNREKIQLHPNTRTLVEAELDIYRE